MLPVTIIKKIIIYISDNFENIDGQIVHSDTI